MIQRLQSLLLLLAAVANFTLLFMPIWMVSNPDQDSGDDIHVVAYPSGVEYNASHMSIDNPFEQKKISYSENIFLTIHFFLTISLSVFLLAIIFLYINRQRQISLTQAGLVFLLVQFLMLIPLRSYLEEMAGTPGADYQSLPQYGLGLPLLALLLTWWASKRIKKDERMVRDMDRIR
ncbi:MAG: DUF4293 family protein [Bacteroidota bacterium]